MSAAMRRFNDHREREADALIGKAFVVFVADGRAKYVATGTYTLRDNDTEPSLILVRVELVPWEGGYDDYKDAVLGEEAFVSYENIERIVARNKLFGRAT